MEQKKDCLCTVLIVSYNQEKYIRKALTSVVRQKTEYGFKVHVFDDGSKDGTQEIIKEFAKAYPEIVIPFLAERNRGPQANIWEAYKSVDTKYCAFLEGDDYWTDEEKLQIQLSIMEEHPECSFCAHNTLYVNDNDKYRAKENNKLFVYNRNVRNTGIYEGGNFLKLFGAGWMNHNNSRVIRMECVDFDSLTDKEDFLYDNAQFFYLLDRGKLYYIQRVMSVYVMNMSSSFTSQSVVNKIKGHWSRMLHINETTEGRYDRLIYRHLASFAGYWLNLQDIEEGEKKEQGDLAMIISRKYKKIRYDWLYDRKLKKEAEARKNILFKE